VHRRRYRAHDLTRSLLALLAKHRLKMRPFGSLTSVPP
jgi:hypothetical protein